MAIGIGSNFLFEGEEFLDKRQSLVKSLDDLKNWDKLVPVGFEVPFNGVWYEYRPDLPKNEETGFFRQRFLDEELVISQAYNDLNNRLEALKDKTTEVETKQDILVADTYEDLLQESNWVINGIDWSYPGMIVSVIADPDTERNGMYSLRGTDYTDPNNWKKVGEETIIISETEPLKKGLIWIDTSNSYTPTTINEDVASLILALQKVQKKVDKLDYAFTHEISFGNFTNNVKTEVGSQPSLEPNTEETTSTIITPLPDGTVTTTTTTVSTNIQEQDGILTTTTTTTVDSTNSGGNSITTIDKVIIQTSIEDQETILYKESSKIVTTITLEPNGSRTTKITTTNVDSDGNETVTTTSTNILQSIVEDSTGTTTTTITTTIDNDGNLNRVTTIDKVQTTEQDEDTTIENRTLTVIQMDGSKEVSEIFKVIVKNSEDLTTTITTRTTVKEYDPDGNLLSDTTTEDTTTEATESIVTYTPNAKHIRIKMGTYKELMAAQSGKGGSPFLSGELLYCYDRNYLYTISPVDNSLVLINSGNSSGGGEEIKVDLTDVDEINFNTIIAGTTDKSKYTVRVDREGKLICYPTTVDTPETKPSTSEIVSGIPSLGIASKALYLPKFYINSVYCGGLQTDKFSYNYCSHNFVELSNLTKNDINLTGLSLQYCAAGNDWKVLPLEGVIKSGGTFLIRGAQCSVEDINTTIINVPTYDMEWYDTDGSLIKFSNVTAKFLLIYGTNKCSSVAPYYTDTATGTTYCEWGYIDSVGLNIPNSTSAATTVDGFEKAQFAQLNSNRILTKYYTMDPVKQATKAIGSRSNANDWYYVELSTTNQETGINGVGVNVKNYQPKSSKENKNIFYNKTKLEGQPELVTVSFGINATDYGQGATRCFNWVSKGYYDEYLWYRRYKVGEQEYTEDWTRVESFKAETILERPEKYQYNIYNRQRVVSTSGEAFTSHKYILPGLRASAKMPVTYQYKVGRPGHESPVYTFVVKNSEDCNSFSFIQTSDQQGFNKDEYNVWEMAADSIRDWELDGNIDESYDQSYPIQNSPEVKGFDFTVNTGDMTQNGNRLNEWLDYYNAGETLFSEFTQMNIIGNNDLCPEFFQGPEGLGDGEDASKINGINFQFFYTYEMDPNNLPYAYDTNGTGYYIHSLYSFNYGKTHFLAVNSEITGSNKGTIGRLYNGADVYGYMKRWCEKDLQSLDKSKTTWTVAYCHEMPFTIITDSLINNWKKEPSKYSRGGSHLNTVGSNPYWFSQLLENYGVVLCIGGHKHTYSCSRNIRENYEWTWTGEAVKGKDNTVVLEKGKKYTSKDMYPWKLVQEGLITSKDITDYVSPGTVNTMQPIVQLLNGEDKSFITTSNADLCVLEQLSAGDYYSAPLYVMSQATGYKQTSNKELPAGSTIIPWLRNYFPATGGAASAGQKYPFYIKWNITENYIRGDVYRVGNVMTNGKYSINSPNTNKKQRLRGNGSSTDSIIIKKQ